MFKKQIKNKKSFTLIEIIIVISIISVVYYFTLSSSAFSIQIKSEQISIPNIIKYTKKFDFKNSLSIKCVNEGKKCFVYVDDVISEEIFDLFTQRPTVYTYNKELDIIQYDDIELEKMQRYEVCFEFKIDKYNKFKDMIVETNNKIYLFNSFYDNPIEYSYLNDIDEHLNDLNDKVNDAI